MTFIMRKKRKVTGEPGSNCSQNYLTVVFALFFRRSLNLIKLKNGLLLLSDIKLQRIVALNKENF